MTKTNDTIEKLKNRLDEIEIRAKIGEANYRVKRAKLMTGAINEKNVKDFPSI